MRTTAMPGVPFWSARGWDGLRERPPSLAAIVAFLVVPLSLVPPLMLYYAGTHYGDAFAPGFGAKQWDHIAIIFLLAELLTFAFMGWLIYAVGNTWEPRIEIRDAYLLAATAPVPLWLSALALFVPSFAFVTIVALAALVLSCGIVYQGLRGLCRMREELVCMFTTYTVMASCVIAWALLLTLVWAL